MFRPSLLAPACLLAVALSGAAAPARAGTYQLLHSFAGYPNDGGIPAGSLIDVGGTLYGLSAYGGLDSGAVYGFNPATGTEALVYSFQPGGTDGTDPIGSLINVGGMLYGTTVTGGTNFNGAVVSINPRTGAEAVVHSFDTSHGYNPEGALSQVGNKLFGTATNGAKHEYGSVFFVNPATGATGTVFSFDGGNGSHPSTGVVAVKGMLYGTTPLGGVAGGVVYAVNPTTHIETVLYAFKGGTDGVGPDGGVIALGGKLYGTTSGGGAGGYGTVFSVDPSTGAETVVYAFRGSKDGADPLAGLLNVHGKLYGTTREGGGNGCNKVGCGTVFVVDPATGDEKVVYSFQGGTDGAFPSSGLIAVGATLYGTTPYGGAGNYGTVFSYTP